MASIQLSIPPSRVECLSRKKGRIASSNCLASVLVLEAVKFHYPPRVVLYAKNLSPYDISPPIHILVLASHKTIPKAHRICPKNPCD